MSAVRRMLPCDHSMGSQDIQSADVAVIDPELGFRDFIGIVRRRQGRVPIY